MIPYAKQDINDEDISAVIDVLKSDFLTQGPKTFEFENCLSAYTGAKYSVALSSATSALHTACLALKLSEGDMVWTSPISFVASANCAFYCRAKIDFYDINPITGLICLDSFEKKLKKARIINSLPKIIILVHLAGLPCDMEAIYRLSHQYGFRIIEDAAHAVGARYLNTKIGDCTFSDITVFSFHPAKIITSGEGGALLTNDPSIFEFVKNAASQGLIRNKEIMHEKSKDPWYYEVHSLGYNYRLTDIQCALGISQLARINNFIEKRKIIADQYQQNLDPNKCKPLKRLKDRESSWHLFIILVEGERNSRPELIKNLHLNQISTNLHYIPIYRHHYLKKLNLLPDNFQLEDYLGAEEYYDKALTIPLYASLENETVSQICSIINEY